MAEAKKIIEPAEIIQPDGDAASDKTKDTATPAPPKRVSFWKGFAPNQPIVLPDGAEHVFGSERFVTSDEKLIEKIKAVAEQYNIFVTEE